MQITKEWLETEPHRACVEGRTWFEEKFGSEADIGAVFSALEGYVEWFSWSNWLITQLLDHVGCVKYAVFAAEAVLPVFERQINDARPRKAIEAAKAWIEKPSQENMEAARAAWDAAWDAAWAVGAAAAAGDAAWAAVRAAGAAAWAAVRAAADAAADAARDTDASVGKEIIAYGIKLVACLSQRGHELVD